MRRGTVELGYSLEKTERKRAIEKRKFQALNFQKMGILFITKDVPRHPNGGNQQVLVLKTSHMDLLWIEDDFVAKSYFVIG